ncbi:MAG: tRNA (adenosine(37)-N6)-threonylcarbamoyltransferase complex dimerization subunit type 1 TsaB [Desulfobacterales bacterium]
MKILAVDTSTKRLNVCISEGETVRAEISCDTNETHSKTIMPAIDSLLRAVKWDLSTIDGFAVTQGPGSFTGIRIGIAAVKGLASAVGKPVVGISTLEVLAYQAGGFSGPVCAMLDARKNEVFSGFFRWLDNRPCRMENETVGPIKKVLDVIDEPCLFIGSGAKLYEPEIVRHTGSLAVFPPLHDHAVRSSMVGRIGYMKFCSTTALGASEIRPTYLRPPDAVLKIVRRG